jgi:lauroyl/myristoyl acyltransferase
MLTWLGIKPFALSMPNPSSAYKAENELRRKIGLEATPLTFSSFREAKHRLKAGQCVITGLDRPVDKDEVKYPIRFFGREANLPGFYPKLALDSGAIVRVGYGITQEDGSFLLDCSEPIEMNRYDDNIREVVLNVEKVVGVAERFIRHEADHWAMLYPVWPEALKEIEKIK